MVKSLLETSLELDGLSSELYEKFKEKIQFVHNLFKKTRRNISWLILWGWNYKDKLIKDSVGKENHNKQSNNTHLSKHKWFTEILEKIVLQYIYKENTWPPSGVYSVKC